MIKGGFGGANTKTGAIFEIETNLKKALEENGYDLTRFVFLEQHTFEKYLNDNFSFSMKKYFGKAFRPDEAVIYNNRLIVIEKKMQSGGGSVDEKIQTGPYKLGIYQKCAEIMGLEGADFIFLLKGEFFDIPKYTTHQLPWNLKNGVPTYFDKLPLEECFKK
jgi:hypothetical protein